MSSSIHNADCLLILSALENESIDCCITDPPYGISYQSARRTDKSKRKPKIENDETPFVDWIAPLFNKMKWGARLICFYRWDVQDEFLQAIQEAGFTVKSQLVWDKVIHGMGDLKGEFAPMHELMIYATKGRFVFENKRPKTIYKSQRVQAESQLHPNQKPVQLMQAIIRDITNEGDQIFEPFGGSFATYIAAIKEKRHCIACELSDHYFKIGSDNILLSIQQQSLF